MESSAGLAAVALFVLWLGYWVPSAVRRRTDLAEARMTDRFSVGLRIVAMSGSGRKGGAMVADGRSPGTGQGVPRVAHPAPRHPAPLQIMVRGRPLTAERLRRAKQRARRAARARRRFIVSMLLLLCSAAAWMVVGFGQLHWGVAVVPSAMLLFVLFLGRRAARAARRADARWTAAVRAARQRATQARALANGGPYVPRNRAQVTGVATRGSDTQTQAIPMVGRKNVLDEILDGSEKPRVIEVAADDVERADGVGGADEALESGAAQQRDDVPSGRAWDPVPVPLPTYVTKPAAPQRQHKALPSASAGASSGAPAGAAAGAAAAVSTAGSAAEGSSASAHAGADAGADVDVDAAVEKDAATADDESPRVKSETLATPLEEILARRRAAG